MTLPSIEGVGETLYLIFHEIRAIRIYSFVKPQFYLLLLFRYFNNKNTPNIYIYIGI